MGAAEEAEAVEKVDAVAALEEVLNKAEANRPKKPYGDVAYADPKNGKYPIDTAEHIRAAWNYINNPKNAGKYQAEDFDKIKSKIVAAWKDKISPRAPPEAEKMLAFGDLEKSAAALGELHAAALNKGLYTVSRFADLLSSFAALQASVAEEAEDESDGSPLPNKLADAVANLGTLLVEMAQEETAEIVASFKQDGEDQDYDASVMQLSAWAVDLVKTDAALMEKAGRRNSAKDQKTVQEMHDHATGLGAACSADNVPAAQDAAKLALAAEKDRLEKALVERAIPRIESLLKSVDDIREAQAEELAKRDSAIEALTKRLAIVEATPAAPTAAVNALGKAEDARGAQGSTDFSDVTAEVLKQHLANLTDAERNLFMMKIALSNPQAIRNF